MAKLKYFLIPAFIVVAIVSISASCLYYLLKFPIFTIGETKYIYIYPTDNRDSIIKKIKETANPTSLIGFELLANHNDLNIQKKTGRYAIYDKDNAFSLYRRLVSGQQTPINLIIPSVRTIGQFTKIVSDQLMFDSLEIADFLDHDIFIANIGYNKATLPSLFLPNTYEVYWNMKPENFITRMMNEHKKFWNKDRLNKAKSIGLTPVEVTTLAAIVDEETNNNNEKPIVAGLYINRLKRGIPLQADPTIKFALGDFTRQRILNADLEVQSPYNTYINKGLPPGPIRIPTLSAIESVLNHAKHNYIYMCAKEDFSGTHNFASTLNEHINNAKRYQSALNQRNIKR